MEISFFFGYQKWKGDGVMNRVEPIRDIGLVNDIAGYLRDMFAIELH